MTTTTCGLLLHNKVFFDAKFKPQNYFSSKTFLPIYNAITTHNIEVDSTLKIDTLLQHPLHPSEVRNKLDQMFH